MGWATLDQAVSSITNFGITVVAARQLTRNGFGAFALALSVWILVLGMMRALVTEPLLSRPELAAGNRRQATFSAVTAASLGLGCLAAIGVLAAGLLSGSDAGRALIALATVLPGLCLQDAWRFCFISQQRGDLAVVNDCAWLITVIVGVLWLGQAFRWSPASVLLAWGCAGGGAGLLGAVQARVIPRPTAGRSWLREQRDLGGRYCLEFITSNGATQVALMGLGAIAGLGALGAVRGAQTFFGPVGVLFSSIILAVVPGASKLRAAPDELRRLLTLISAAVCTGAVAWTVVGVALPDRAGRALFGASWNSTRDVVLPIGLALIASGVAAGPFAGLRSISAAREGLHVRLLSLPLLIGGPLAGAVISGAGGFAYGLAVSTVGVAGMYWWQFTLASTRIGSGP
jgi:hypothetical protein